MLLLSLFFFKVEWILASIYYKKNAIVPKECKMKVKEEIFMTGCVLRCRNLQMKAAFENSRCFCIKSDCHLNAQNTNQAGVIVFQEFVNTPQVKVKTNASKNSFCVQFNQSLHPTGEFTHNICCEIPDDYRCRVPAGYQENNPAASCISIKEAFNKTKSGFFWLILNNQILKVYCDMESDGGGWLLIGNVTLTNEEQYSSYEYNNASSDDLYSISNTTDTNHLLRAPALNTLRNTSRFSKVRIFCRKSYHNRTMDFVMEDPDTINYLTVENATVPTVKGIRFLANDNSRFQINIGNAFCQSTSSFTKRLYNELFFVPGLSHVNIQKKGRMECDDYLYDKPKLSLGKWLYFVK